MAREVPLTTVSRRIFNDLLNAGIAGQLLRNGPHRDAADGVKDEHASI